MPFVRVPGPREVQLQPGQPEAAGAATQVSRPSGHPCLGVLSTGSSTALQQHWELSPGTHLRVQQEQPADRFHQQPCPGRDPAITRKGTHPWAALHRGQKTPWQAGDPHGEGERCGRKGMVTTSGEETRLFCVKDSMLREAPRSDAKSSKVSSSIVCANTETPAPTGRERRRQRQRDKERERERKGEFEKE